MTQTHRHTHKHTRVPRIKFTNLSTMFRMNDKDVHVHDKNKPEKNLSNQIRLVQVIVEWPRLVKSFSLLTEFHTLEWHVFRWQQQTCMRNENILQKQQTFVCYDYWLVVYKIFYYHSIKKCCKSNLIKDFFIFHYQRWKSCFFSQFIRARDRARERQREIARVFVVVVIELLIRLSIFPFNS